MKRILMVLAVVSMVLVASSQAQAIVLIGDSVTPGDGRGAWITAVGSYLDVVIPGQEYGSVSVLTSPYSASDTLTFSSALSKRIIGSSWATWSSYGGSHVGDSILYTDGLTSITGTFSGPVSAFGLEMETNPYGIYNMTLTLSDGSVLSQNVEGYAGARFFGWKDGAVTSMTLSSTADFAFGRMVTSDARVVPEPATMSLFGLGLLGLVGKLRKKNS